MCCIKKNKNVVHVYCVHDFVYWQQEQSSSGVNKRCRVNNFMILSVVVTISMSDINGFHKTHWFMPLLKPLKFLLNQPEFVRQGWLLVSSDSQLFIFMFPVAFSAVPFSKPWSREQDSPRFTGGKNDQIKVWLLFTSVMEQIV